LERCQLVIYSDGPKISDHEAAVAETRCVLRDWGPRLGAEVIEQSMNLGLARSIVGGVTRLVAVHGRVIVLEDDLVPTPDFLAFMLAGLDRYADDDRVAQISGCLLTDNTSAESEGLFLPLATSWGWATWERAWRLFRWEDEIDLAELERDPAFRARFTLNGDCNYERMLNDRVEGKNDSWGVLWWFAIAKADKLVLYPRTSLIWNGGFDNSGVHCGGKEEFRPTAPDPFRVGRLSSPIHLPDVVAIDPVAMAAVQQYLRRSRWSGRPRNKRNTLVRLGLKVRQRLNLAYLRRLVRRERTINSGARPSEVSRVTSRTATR